MKKFSAESTVSKPLSNYDKIKKRKSNLIELKNCFYLLLSCSFLNYSYSKDQNRTHQIHL